MAAVLLATTHAALAACPSCGSSPCTISGTSTIASGDTCNYAGKDVILTGTLNGDNNAACYTVVADNLTVRGTLRARGSCINVTVSGNFKTESVSNSAATVDVRNADSTGDGVYVTCGTATINGKAINANADGDQTPFYYPSGDIDIICSGAITGTGGPITADATGGDDGGIITVVSTGSTIDLSSQLTVNGGGTFSFGGSIYVDGSGNVTVGGATNSLEAQSAQGGSAGSVEIVSGGTATINGAINVNGNGDDTDGGTISVTAAAVSTGTSWNARGDRGGDGGSIDVNADSGAGTVTTTSGSASWNVAGASATGDGGWGGGITVAALGDISLSGDMDAAGNGESASGGTIDISTTNGDLVVETVSRLEADSAGTDATDGLVYLTGCDMTIKGDVDTRNTSLDSGSNAFDYAGTFTQNTGSTMLADNDGANDVLCRCIDTSPADGVCDTPATCVSAPTFNGTVTPAASIIPVPRASCS
ncbi:MAG: hypothetical protein ACRERC_14785 [Candidatus Binatia bacterium]